MLNHNIKLLLTLVSGVTVWLFDRIVNVVFALSVFDTVSKVCSLSDSVSRYDDLRVTIILPSLTV